MQHSSFLVYRRFFYLKLSLALLVLSLLAYFFHQPVGVPNGGTWLGYALGTVGALLILWLMWLGVRKRRYHSRSGNMRGWVSAHVYLGLSLVFIATLHTGFQFGWNVHTLSYALMILVVVSGIYGVAAYLRYPSKMAENQGGLTRNTMLYEVAELETECLQLAADLPAEIQELLSREAERMKVGGGAWQQLTGSTDKAASRLSPKQRETLQKLPFSNKDGVYDASMYLLAEQMMKMRDSTQQEHMRRILELLGRKNALLERLRENIRFQAFMDIWLYFHIPLSFALLAALIVHVVSVFLYW